MKRILFLLLMALPLCIVACSKTSAESDSSEKQAESEYYVKYASDGLGGNGIYEYSIMSVIQMRKESGDPFQI